MNPPLLLPAAKNRVGSTQCLALSAATSASKYGKSTPAGSTFQPTPPASGQYGAWG